MKYLSPTATISVWPRKSLVFDATRGWQFFTPSNDETWKDFVQTMSVDKDAELAQKVSIDNKKKSEHYKDQIGIILEVINLGYETKEGELILTAEVIVTSK